MTCPILLAPTADLARHTLAHRCVVLTVEAEYGSFVAEGRLHTAAHHQPVGSPYAGRHLPGGTQPSPCNSNLIPHLTELDAAAGAIILVSHLDLDTVGGCLRSMIAFRDLFPIPGTPAPTTENIPNILLSYDVRCFWEAAELVDVLGMHRVNLTERTTRQIYAYLAWERQHKPQLPQERVSDVTWFIAEAGDALRRIFCDDEGLLKAGLVLREQERELNRQTFAGMEGPIIKRVSEADVFCNHLYQTPERVQGRAVVALNLSKGSVTLSLAEPIPGVSCREVAQSLWGTEAGGHDGIAGSPRGQQMTLGDLAEAVAALRARL